MVDDDDQYMEYLGISDKTIHRLRTSDSDKRRMVIENELRDLMKAPKSR